MLFIVAGYHFAPYSLALLASTVVGLAIAVVARRRPDVRASVYLIILGIAVAEWALGQAFEAAATTLPEKILWSQVAYFGKVAVPLAYFLVAAAYALPDWRPSRRALALLSVVPVITVIAAWTNDYHHQLWSSIVLNPETNIAIYGHRALFFFVNVAYAYTLIAASALPLVVVALSLHKSFCILAEGTA